MLGGRGPSRPFPQSAIPAGKTGRRRAPKPPFRSAGPLRGGRTKPAREEAPISRPSALGKEIRDSRRRSGSLFAALLKRRRGRDRASPPPYSAERPAGFQNRSDNGPKSVAGGWGVCLALAASRLESSLLARGWEGVGPGLPPCRGAASPPSASRRVPKVTPGAGGEGGSLLASGGEVDEVKENLRAGAAKKKTYFQRFPEQQGDGCDGRKGK